MGRWFISTRYIIVFFIFTGLLVSHSGCFMLAPFQSSKRLDLSPFAANIIIVTADIQNVLYESQVVYLKDYVNVPELGKFEDDSRGIREVIRHIVAYSLDLVTLAQSKLSDKERVKQYIYHLKELMELAVIDSTISIKMTSAEIDSIYMKMLKERDVLDAFFVSQPLIDEFSEGSIDLVHECKDALDNAVKAVSQQLKEDNRIFVAGHKAVRIIQINSILNLGYLQQYHQGETHALDSLLAKEPSLSQVIKNKNQIASEDILAIEERLLYRLRTLNELRDQITPDLEYYDNQLRELDDFTKMYDRALGKARLLVTIWARAHGKMAAGITDPAYIDIGAMFQRAVSSYTPKI